jgi:hypothetical protein
VQRAFIVAARKWAAAREWAMASQAREEWLNFSEPARSLQAAQAKVAALLNPRNVVIVGASDTPTSWAMRAFQNLQRYHFPGAVYPINPRRTGSGTCAATTPSTNCPSRRTMWWW